MEEEAKKKEEDHCLSQAVKKYPVFLHFVG